MCKPIIYKHDGKHWLIPRLKLLIDFPDSPKGAYFTQDMVGEWFMEMTDKEFKKRKRKGVYLPKAILDNPKLFKKLKPRKL